MQVLHENELEQVSHGETHGWHKDNLSSGYDPLGQIIVHLSMYKYIFYTHEVHRDGIL